MKVLSLGDEPIEPQYVGQMKAMAQAVDEFLNGEPSLDRVSKHGFIIMMFPFDSHEGRCNYISNANRDDVVILLKEQLARFQGQPNLTGRA